MMKILFIVLFLKLVAFANSSCKKGWQKFENEKCYKLFNDFLTWDEAIAKCQSLENVSNSTMLTIKSVEEQDFIQKWLFIQKEVSDNVWLGARRINAKTEFR